ncbi:MAG: TetR/AcrR family transcriptional regulator [Aquihabitans sp.]
MPPVESAPPSKRSGTRSAVESGADTKDRLLRAARDCLREDGIAGVSARAIARHGNLNQALVFYHFGSVDGLLQAVARTDSERRSLLYAERLSQAATLADLVKVGRQIHAVESDVGNTAVLAQLVAGAARSTDLGAAVRDGMSTWTAMIEDALGRVLDGTPLAGAVSPADVAYAIASLFLGLELMGGVDGDATHVESLFTSLDAVAGLVDLLLRPIG